MAAPPDRLSDIAAMLFGAYAGLTLKICLHTHRLGGGLLQSERAELPKAAV
jgi:hypothetical protein